GAPCPPPLDAGRKRKRSRLPRPMQASRHRLRKPPPAAAVRSAIPGCCARSAPRTPRYPCKTRTHRAGRRPTQLKRTGTTRRAKAKRLSTTKATRPTGADPVRRIGWRHILPLVTAASLLVLWSSGASAQDLSIDFGDDTTLTERAIQLIGLITLLSLAPSILVMVTSFTRIVVVLSLLRTAIGLQTAPPNSVMVSLALFLTLFIM